MEPCDAITKVKQGEKMRFIRIITPVLFAFTLIIWVMLCFLTNRDADQTSPVIMSEIDVLQLSVNDDKSKLMDGLTAQDNIDGDLTNEIMIGSQSKFLSPGFMR